MIPSFWVLLDELPLTPNGKVDRLSLPAPDRSRGALGTEYAPPRDPVEERLVEIWANLLGLDQVGIHDNFFKLGGHSLLGTVLMSRVRDAFDIDLPVLRLFETPTVAGLSEVVRQQAGQGRAGGRQEEIERGGEGRLLAQVDSLSSEQVDALLSELLGEEEAAL
jgi:acyl carrier protein